MPDDREVAARMLEELVANVTGNRIKALRYRQLIEAFVDKIIHVAKSEIDAR